MPATSLPVLLLACLVYAAVQWVRPGRGMCWRPVLAGAAGMLMVGLVVAGLAMPTGGSYPTAENDRVVRAAVETAERDAVGADCVVIVDGSSIFTHALDMPLMRAELAKAGLRPCVLTLAMLGGEHFEREWMARRLRTALSEKTRARLDALPLLWVKELHWTYESHPARFVASNADTPRILAHCEPGVVLNMIQALHGNWKNDCRSDHLNGLAAWRAFPVEQTAAALRQGVFNLFHVGQIRRLMETDPGSFSYICGKGELEPTTSKKAWWKDRPALDAEFDGSSQYKPRRWFERLLADAPSTWPQRKGFELVLATAPGQSRYVQDYAAELEKRGTVGGRPLLLAARDLALRKQLDEVSRWRDHIHLESEGVRIYTRWLVAHLVPRIETLKGQSAVIQH